MIAAPREVEPRRTTGATAALVAGCLYAASGLMAAAAGALLFAAFGGSIDHAAGSPEGSAGAVFLFLFGIAGEALAAIGVGMSVVGIAMIVLAVSARRGRNGAATALLVMFSIGALAKIAALAMLHSSAAIGTLTPSLALDVLVAFLLVRDRGPTVE